MSRWQQTAILNSKGLSASSKETLASMAGLAAAETAQGAAAAGAAAGTSTLGAAIQGAAASIASFVVEIAPIIPLALAVGVAFQRAYSAAHAYENAMEEAENAQSNYDSTVSELESVNNELSTTKSRIEELQGKSTLTLTEQAELDQLQSQNTELERQASLLENVADMQRRTATNKAMDALKVEGSQSKYSKEHAAELDGAVGYTTELEAAREDLKHLKKLYAERADLQKRVQSASESGDQELYEDLNNQLLDTDDEINNWTNSLGEQVSKFQEYRDTLAQDTNLGQVSGGKQMLSDLDNFITDFSNVGKELTPTQEALQKIQSFFDGSTKSNAISEAILDDITKNGGTATEAIKRLGLSLNDLGLDASQGQYLNRYFDDLAKSAQKASEAVDKVDGSMSGIKEAIESQNAGSQYETMSGYLKTAKDLYDRGLVGTDDFQTVAKFIARDTATMEDAAKNFSDNYNRIQRYFTTDDNGNFTKAGIDRFASDLTAKMQETGKSFKSTSEAANALGMSTEAFEVVLGRLGDYELSSFNQQIQDMYNNLPRSAQAFSEAKTGLSSLQEAYNNFDVGSTGRDTFGQMIEEWDTALSEADGDLSKFDPEIVVKIKAALDLAQIQQEIDELQLLAQEEGGKNAATNAGLNAKTQTYINKSEDLIGIGKSDKIEIPVVYKEASNTLDKLHEQLRKTTSEEEVVEIQAEIKNVQNVQKSILDAFMSAHPEVNFDANPAEAESTFNSWVASAEGREVLAKITADNGEALQSISELTGISIDDLRVMINADADTSDAEESLEDIDSDVTIPVNFESDAFDGLEGLDDEEKTIIVNYVKGLQENPEAQNALMSYIISNQDNPENMNALVDYIKNHQDDPDAMSTLVNYLKGSQQGADPKNTQVNYTKGSQSAPKPKSTKVNYTKGSQGKPTKQSAKVNYVKGTQQRPSAMSAIVNYVINAVTPFNGTVHYNGTTINQFYGTAHASGDWGIKKDETALINEVGKEVVVRDGKWFTVNNGYPAFTKLKKGDIVFNHKQTEELMRKGYVTNSHAKIYGSYSNGSAHADGTIGGVAYASGTSNKNTVDWIEIALERLEAIANKYSTRVENAFLNLSTRLTDLSSAISATKTQLSKQQTAYSSYMAAANKVNLSSDLKQKVRDGAYYVYDGYSEAEKESIDKYKDLIDKANQCKEAMDELSQSLSELYKQAFEIVETQYKNQFDALSNREKLILNNIELAKARGYSANPTDYESLIQYMQREVTKGQSEYADLVKKMNEAVASGTVKKWSAEWWEMYNATLEVAAGIQEADISLKEYQQDILDLKWDNFDYIQKQISQIADETDFLIDLLSNAELFDDSGKLTDSGMASVSLRKKQMDLYTKQAKEYAEEINNIDKLLANDPANKNLIDRRNELLKSQRDIIESVQDEKDAIKDLIEDAYDAQVDALEDIVDAYSDSLDSSKDLFEYQRKIQEGTANLASLQKQLDIYSNDTSEETRAKAQKLQVEFEDAQKDLEETQYDQYVSEIKKMLDNLTDDYKEALFAGLDDVDSLLSDILSSVENPTEIQQTIQNAVHDAGYTITENLSKIIHTDNVENILNSIDTSITELLNHAEHAELDNNNDVIINDNGIVQTASPEQLSPVITMLKGNNSYGSTTRKKIFGFSDGGFVAELQKAALANGDDLLTVNTLKAGEAVLTPEQTKALCDLAPRIPMLEDIAERFRDISLLNSSPSINMGDTHFSHEWNINVENANDFRDIMHQATRSGEFEKFIQSITVDLLAGKSKTAKYKYFS